MQPDELKALRKAAGMSQAEMAHEIGMSRKAIVEMEGGKAPIEKRTGLAVELVLLRSLDGSGAGSRRAVGSVFVALARDEETEDGGDVWYIQSKTGQNLAVIHDEDRAMEIARSWP
jgi:transcriptional regulator with XRE-family HTH domain